MIEILTKIGVKMTIIVVENRESYYFIIIYKGKEVQLSLFSYQMLASTFNSDERSSYYKVYALQTHPAHFILSTMVIFQTQYIFFSVLKLCQMASTMLLNCCVIKRTSHYEWMEARLVL